MTGTAGALQQARHAFGRADLKYPVDGQEIDAQVQAGGTHYDLEPAFLQAELHPLAHRPVQRAVMQRDDARPLGACREQRPVPDLRLRARIGKYQRGTRRIEFGRNRFDLT